MPNLRIVCRLGLACLAAAGCGPAEFAPVSGVVTFEGEPIVGATVTFDPVNGKRASYATTDSSGRFELIVAGIKDQAGAVIGEHRVKVTAIAESSPSHTDDPDLGSLAMVGQQTRIRYLIPPRYDDFNASGLSFSVPPGGSDEADFALKR